MYEFELYNKINGEREIRYGYWESDMWKRNPSLNPEDWDIIGREYID